MITRKIETTNCQATVSFDDKSFTVSYAICEKHVGAKVVKKTFKHRDRESARAAYARVIAGFTQMGQVNSKIQVL